MEPMLEVTVLFAALNIILLIVLLSVYAKIAFRSRASYSIGLLTFAVFLLLHNLILVYSYVTMATMYELEVLPFLLTVAGLEFAGLLVLLGITL